MSYEDVIRVADLKTRASRFARVRKEAAAKDGQIVVVTDYDTDAILEHLADQGVEAIIPPRSHRVVQRSFDHHQYKNRNLVERFFCRIKQFRLIATRYDKLAERFASFIALAASVIWLA